MSKNFKDNLLYLLRILNSIAKIEIYSKNFNDPNEFFYYSDSVNFNASLLLLTTIGEWTSKLTLEIKNKYDYIPWQRIKDVRNRVVHEYHGVDHEIAFEIVKSELKKLEKDLIFIITENIKEKNFDIEDLKVAQGHRYYKYVDFNLLLD